MKDTILSLEKQAMERWRNGDPSGFVEISDRDITYIDPSLTRPLLGLGEYKIYMEQLKGRVRYQVSEFINPKVVTAGDAAVLSYNYRSIVLDAGETIIGQTPWNATTVYFRRNGEWKIVHNHWSYIRHKLPGKMEIPVPIQSSPKKYDGILGQVMVLESAAMERWRRGDPWGFTGISAPDVTYFDTGTPQRINGLESLKAEYAQREGKIFFDVMDFIDPGIQVCGNMAVLVYRFLNTWLNPDGSVLKRTPWNCTEVFIKIDGQWRIIHTHWSYIKGERCEKIH